MGGIILGAESLGAVVSLPEVRPGDNDWRWHSGLAVGNEDYCRWQ